METEKVDLKEDALNREKWRRSASNCKRNGVNPAIFAKGLYRKKTEYVFPNENKREATPRNLTEPL